jgi:hypothetical protein
VQTNQSLKAITDAQTAQSTRFSSPLTSFAVFYDYFAKRQQRARAISEPRRKRDAEWSASMRFHYLLLCLFYVLFYVCFGFLFFYIHYSFL